MNKKKLLSLALAVIMIAILSFGTLAWFSASNTATNKFMVAGSEDADPDDIFSVDVWEDMDGDGVKDETWQDLCTVRVIDTVIPGIRNALHTKFRRAKNTPRGRGAIRAQVVLELENFLKREIITAYDGVTVTADETDPTRALVDFSFTVAHGLNQIWLSAHITV